MRNGSRKARRREARRTFWTRVLTAWWTSPWFMLWAFASTYAIVAFATGRY